MKRTALRYRSKKRARDMMARRDLVHMILSERPWCEARWDDGCFGRSVDVHEIKRRSAGGPIIGGADYEYMAVCRYCHSRITEGPEEARQRGFSVHSWEQIK